MPRKDPIFGCTVMTNSEFWCAEAEHEGKGRTGADLQTDFYMQMEEERCQQEKYYQNKEEALNFLRLVTVGELKEYRYAKKNGEKCTYPNIPIEVTYIDEVHVKDSFKEHGVTISGNAKCKDGKIRRFFVSTQNYSGDFYEPPSEDVFIHWSKIGILGYFEKSLRKFNGSLPRVTKRINKVYIPRVRKYRDSSSKTTCLDFLNYVLIFRKEKYEY